VRLYPQLAQPRTRQLVRDGLVVAALLLFAALAWAVRSAVMALTAISEGFTSTATGAQDSWNGVGESLGRVPLVGDEVRERFEGLAAATFGNAAESGQAVTDAVTTAANVLALVTFVAPAAVLMGLWLPGRLRRARSWDAAQRVLALDPATGSSSAIEELLALRALCHLPLAELARSTPRPFEAYANRDFAPLVAALYAHEGMAAPGVPLGGSAPRSIEG
jgi:hypothetical protein